MSGSIESRRVRPESVNPRKKPPSDKPPNLSCPRCGPARTLVLDSRTVEFGGVTTIRRRRRCDHCGLRFTTHEILAYDEDGRMLNATRLQRKLDKIQAVLDEVDARPNHGAVEDAAWVEAHIHDGSKESGDD